MSATHYDVVVIGAGSGGLTAAVGFAKIGKNVLLIEKDRMGGECTNTGCIPSKALLHHAKTYHATRKLAGESTMTEAYRKAAFAYVRGKVESIRDSEAPEVFQKMGIDVVMGEASFQDPCSVKVGSKVYGYKRAVIATGSAPRMLGIEGLEEEDVLTNENLFDLPDVPRRTLVIGSGPIGMEMGQALAMLGSEVTIATIDSAFARLEDPTIRPVLQERFETLGITIELNAFIQKVEGNTAVFDRKESEAVTGSFSIPFDKILIAVGRVPNLPDGLGAAGIAFDERCILVDGQFRTSNKYVYALGDVASRQQFTHMADDAARQIVTREASRGLLRVNRHKAVPKVTYTEPEVAQVGLSYDDACRKYDESEVMRIEVPYSENDRAQTDSATEGVMIVIARRVTGAVLGANIAGPHAGELVSVFTLAIDQKLSMWSLRRTIYAYPTYSLLIKKAGDRFFALQIANLRRDINALMIKHAPKLVALVVWAILLSLLYSYKDAHGMDTTETALMVFDFVSMTVWGPLVYILAYVVRPLTFFPATALTILSGVFFGFWGGFVYTVIAASVSASVAYGVGRFFGGGLKLEDTFLGNWITALRTNSFESTLIMRLIFLPFDGVSYLAGILKITFLPFLLATFIGTLLGIATFVSLGASISIEEFRMEGLSVDVFEPRYLLLSLLIFVISIVLSRLLKHWRAETES